MTAPAPNICAICGRKIVDLATHECFASTPAPARPEAKPGALAETEIVTIIPRLSGRYQTNMQAALADLRALIARCEAAEAEQGALRGKVQEAAAHGFDAGLAHAEAAETAVSTMRAAINERVSERDAAKDHAKALAAALDGAIATIERGYAPSVADKAALAAAPFRAALAAYRGGGAK